jgi:thiamine biosynthesis lipoprotein
MTATAQSELTVARRAMACEFSVHFPAGTRGGVDAGLAAMDEIDRLEQRLSVFIEASELSRLNRAAARGAAAAAEDLYDLLRFTAILSRATGGAFDAAAGALLRAWGFQGGPLRVPPDAERLTALAASGSMHVKLDDERRTVAFDRPGVTFNLGAIGKGYAIDCAVRILVKDFGVRSALIGGGQSSLRAIGAPPREPRGWKVDIGEPAIARVHLCDRALGTSGAANQFFESGGRRWGHILDPRTGWPAARLVSASVLAKTAAEADALSTAFFVMGAEAARQFCRRHPGIGAVLVHSGTPRVELVGAPEVEVIL